MRIAITCSGQQLSDQVSPIFGRCNYIMLVDTDTMQTSALLNSATSAPGGAGVQTAQFMVNQGAEAIISGNYGPNALQVLQAAGITLYGVQGGTAREAVDALLDGRLQPVSAATVSRDYGKAGAGGGRAGRGMGRGARQRS